MLRKASVGLTTLAIATTTAVAPALAEDTTPETTAAETTAAVETTTETAPEQDDNGSSKLNKENIHDKLDELSSKHQDNKQDLGDKHEEHQENFHAKLDELSSKTDDFNEKAEKFIKNIDFSKIQDALKVIEKIIEISAKLA
ncbi:hypothetical protein QP970_06590 [Corynebacterium sp. MSK073]|uniref:hypothetical protein n=1 Tax=Corynebacterium sp. MSK073 TaxID=3050198 RepID=UPI00254BA5A8|nr:hypothetical protein [Corynebacterium sp. MSK073]MDK8815029.1 hypothetical protein [Corynebacterium sp. MSK073]